MTEPITEKKIESSKPEEPKKYTAEEFIKEYNAFYIPLCQKTGFQLVTNPVYIRRDDGSYSTLVQSSVGELPKQKST